MTKLRVLIVDDEAMFTQSLRRLLQRQHDIAVANDGLEALTAVRAGQRFDVILSDVNMPQMTGIELFEQLLELAPDQAQHFVFLTGGAFGGPTQQRLRALGTRQLEKPVDITALRAMIVEVGGGGGGKGSSEDEPDGGNGGGTGGGNGSGSGGNGRMSEGPGAPNERLSASAGY